MSMEYPGHCPLTVAARHNPSVFEILSSAKEIRDNLLKQTEKGRAIISLYATCSPTLVKAIFFDGRFRAAVFDGLAKLKPAIAGIQATLDGEDRHYVFTAEDADTVSYLMDLTIERLPRNLAKQVRALKQELQLSAMPGRNVKDYLTAVQLL
ncbi:hypothetical protein [Desulforamulus ferrireducens]|uniref:Uncharacterized protein n=1 Tax=Desulforamulus ferrireducens TaxID=1833852 RepID=A0A1S6IY72_9FIRM|nr:hypothetical protein [Desulforamulus ferrireducens]AQS59719.1 hypothetical protein B0537_11910 [Desulforamulus ferrireducens]